MSKSIKKRGAIIIAVAMAVMLVISSLSPAIAMAAVDGDTRDNYQNVLEQGTSTKDSGRVWSDKSVYDQPGNIGAYNMDLKDGENFNIAYSLLGSSEKITGKSDSALDVVFILDTSGSMENETSDGKTRINAAIEALNHSLDTLLTDNPNNRVGVATFATGSEVLMPLANYKSKAQKAWTETIHHPAIIGPLFGTVIQEAWDEVIQHPAVSGEYISFDGDKVNAKWEGGSNSVKFAGGTNTQLGFATGMNMLANAKETTATINGKTVKRVPIVVMLSDGASTYSVNSSKGNWWNPSGSKQGPGNSAYYGNGMLAMMTASYKKQAINEHYGVKGTPAEARVYTIGLGVGDLKKDEKALAQVTLNPTIHWEDTNTNINNKIRTQWTEYTKQGKDQSIKVTVEDKKTYTAKHPTVGNDITDLKYENGYYETSNAAELDKVFEGIVNEIIASAPDYPTEIKGTNAATSGYVTYTDPIGQYMEVKNVKAIVYDETEYKLTGDIQNGFKGSGTIKDPVTGKDVSLEGLTVNITTDASGMQTLTAKVPAAAIPLKINEVKLRKDGTVESNTTVANPSPIRIIYSVGMVNGADTLEGVSQEYINKNTENGKVNFYSNLFTGRKDKNGKTVGEAKTEFTPAKDNPNYYFQQDVTVYHDRELTKPVKVNESFDAATTYYIGTPYYNGVTVNQAIVARNGAAYDDAKTNGYLVDSNGNWALKAETPRNYQIEQDFAKPKANNTTGTAEMLYSPSVDKSGFTINKIAFRHGNNGKVQADAPGNLVIKKTVTSEVGVPTPDRTYSFDVTMASYNGQTVAAQKTDANGKVTNVDVIFDRNGKAVVELKDKESFKILNCMGSYEVAEQDPGKGFTVNTPTNAKGNIQIAEDTIVEFTNEYKVTPIDINQTEFGFPMSKTMTGRSFKDTDKFTFTITGPEGAMPAKTEAVIDGSNVKGQTVAEIDFGKFTFTKPGSFDYIITETTGSVPGVTYDAVKYKLTVVISDDGSGNLSVASSKVFKDIGTGNWAPVNDKKMSFTNSYNAESTSVNISGKKVLENKGLDELARAFEFRIKAVTEGAPMPANLSEHETVSASKIDGSISFNNIEFATKDLGKTYEYVITEIQPTNNGEYGTEKDGLPGAVRDANGNWVYKGITFDHSEKKVSIAVTSSDEGETSTIVATPTGNNFEFNNIYHADGEYKFTDAKDGEPGIKNITGRKFKSGDSFTFDVTSEVSDGNISKEAKLPTEVTIRPTADNQFKFDFGNLKFTEADAGKTFTYTFRERTESLGGITYDPAVKVVKLKVNDQNDGTLSIERTGDTLEWTNKYKSEWKYEGFEFTGLKALDGKDEVPVGAFSFTIQGLDGAPLKGGNELNNNTVINTNGLMNTVFIDKERTFYILDHQKYTMEDLGGQTEKTFVYEIKEVIPDPVPAGMKYDNSTFRVAVKVIDDQEGNINASYSDLQITKLNVATGIFEPAEYVEFKNVYHPEETTVVPFVEGNSLLKKQLIGPRKDNLKADEFKFEFELKSATNENGVEIVNGGKDSQVGNKAPGKDTPNLADVVFEKSKITFKEVGTYVFTVKELPTTVSGVTNTVPEIEITYNVVDKDGKLVATPSFTGAVKNGVFVNEYKTSGKVDGKTTLEVEKILTGREWTENDSFEFNLEANDAETSTAVELGYIKLNNSKVTINNATAGHKAAFGDIEIKYPGTYTFKVSENTAGLQPGVHGDSVNRILTVKAVDNGDGTLAVTSSIKADVTAVPLAGEKDNLKFTNVYKPGEATLSGQANLNVTKKLTGRDWLPSDEFTFTLEAGDTDTAAAVGSKVIFGEDENATSITITNRSVNQTEHFGDIVFKDAGRYTFNVTESRPKAPNVSYETEPKQVIVDVVLNDDGTLSAALDRASDRLTFSNVYKPTPGKLDGAANLAVTKEITGRDWLEGETFQFELIAANEAAKDQTKVVLPEETVITVDAATKTNHFGDITFNEKGIYEFDIVEKIPVGVENGANGLTYDTVAKHVVVNVKDNNDGTLTITKNEKLSDALNFINTYVPTPLTYDGATNLQVKKIIDGREWIAGDKFTFTLEYDRRDASTEAAYKSGAFLLPDLRTVDIEYKEGNDNNAYVANFGNIIFKKAGNYKFTIAENKGDIPGITYDNTVKEFTVKVTDDGKGTLTATANGLSTFTNKYEAKPVVFPAQGKGDLQVTKVFTGRPGDKWNEDDSFTFTLAPRLTYPAGSFELGNTEVTITGKDVNKVATFGDIKFFKAGKYEFIIDEVSPADVKYGIHYDTSVKRVAVEVTDDGKGQLHANVIEKLTDQLIFRNEYKASDLVIIPTQKPDGSEGTIGIKLNKVLTGREWKDGDSFSFKIEGLDGAPSPSKTECTVTNTNQKFDFGILRITQADMKGAAEKTFRYKVTEVIPENPIPGVKYDTNPIVFKVFVTDNGKGFLIAGDTTPDSSLIKNEADNLNAGEFTNVYTPAPADLDGAKNLKVDKNFTGRQDNKWNETDEFTFQLTISDPGTNAALSAGNIVLPENAKGIKITEADDPKENAFGNITFKKAGTYKFDVTEINQSIAGVTYAPAQEITVVVTDDKNGKLVPTVKAGTELKPFNNTYKTGSDTLSGKDHLNVVKQIEGRDWISTDSFTFTIESNNQVTTDAITAGKIVMPAANEVTITIDDETVGHTKNFGNITFTKAGDYEFKVTEKLPEGVTAGPDGTAKKDGIVYNTTPQIVKVSVKDMGDGTLKANTKTEKMTFVNKYEHGTVTLDGKTHLKITKKLDGIGQWEGTDKFEFYITANNKLAQTVELPQNIVIDNSCQTERWEVYYNNFADITFSEPGVYEFYIHEKVPANKIPGVVYDTTPRKVVVTVTDDNKGNLSVTSEPQNFEFKNTFSPAPTQLPGLTYLNVQKMLHGRNWIPGDSFTFTLTPDADTAAMNTATKTAFELPANANGLVLSYDPAIGVNEPHKGNFGNIKFYEKGLYKFDVVESKGSIPNIKYDEKKYTVEILVIENRTTGRLEAYVRNVYVTNKPGDESYNGTSYYEENNHTVIFDENIYNPDPAVLPGTDITIKKELIGREWKPGDKFEFKLEMDYLQMSYVILPEQNPITIEYNENGNYTAHFGDITFKEAGNYEFKLLEVKPESPIPGVTYAGYQIVKVKVTDDLHGKLHAEVVGPKTYEFTNAYKAAPGTLDGKTNLQVQKVFDGRDEWQAGDSFTFKLAGKTQATKDAIEKGIVTLGNTEVIINAADQIKNFGNIKFTKAGSYVFEVSEVIPEDAPAYINYDKTKKTIFVEVTDDTNGHLVAKLSDTDAKSVFTNKYDPKPAVLDGKTKLKVEKVLEGRDWTKGDTFLFEMTGADDTTKAAINNNSIEVPENFAEISITDKTSPDKVANFGDIKFHKPGTFTFRVSEKSGTIKAITYDEVGRIVKVVVKDDLKGKLSVDKVSVTADPEYRGKDKDNLTFTNKYITKPVQLNGDTYLNVQKVFTGRDWNNTDKFTFKLEADPEDTSTATAIEKGNVLLPANATGLEITKADAPSYAKAFGNVTFKAVGTYKFLISEVVPGDADKKGITYAQPQSVEVVVTDNLDGTLTATAKKGKAYVFENTYSSKNAILEGDANLKVQKIFTGKEWTTDDVFTFELKTLGLSDKLNVENGNQTITINNKNIVNNGTTGEGMNIKNVAEKAFANITFKKAGHYTFRITEVKGENANMSYADNRVDIHVDVVDNEAGQLVATVDEAASDSIIFTNAYTPEKVVVGPSGNAAVEAVKTLEGRAMTANDKWSFTIRKAEGTAKGTPLPEVTTIENNMDKVVFGDMEYSKPGVYKYVIAEGREHLGGVTNDTGKVEVTVTVTYDAAAGTLKAAVAYGNNDNTFVNTYKVDPTDLSGKKYLGVSKKLTGRPDNKWTENDKYKFTLELDMTDEATKAAKDTITLPENAKGIELTSANKASNFGNITFTKPGTYKFVITEVDTKVPGVTYDSKNTRTVTVKVVDELDGTMTATAGQETPYEFTNTYGTEDAILNGDANLKVQKTFTGKNWTDEEFKFNLTPVSENITDDTVVNGNQTITIKKANIIENGITGTDVNIESVAKKAFGDITFKAADTYTFKIAEVKGNAKGFTYASNEATVTVHVYDNKAGKLVAEVVTDKTDKLEFVNSYKPESVVIGPSGKAKVEAVKTLTGREMTEKDKWSFTISTVKGTAPNTPLPDDATVMNNMGSVVFGDMTYTKPGVYKYVITEGNEKFGGVTNDTNPVYATVEVTYDGDKGKLSATVTYVDNDNTFENTYKATPATLDGSKALKVKKTLNGRPDNKWIVDDKYEFTLSLDMSDTFTAANAAAVKLPADPEKITLSTHKRSDAFGNITFTKPGTYQFLITELDTDVPGVSYDNETTRTVRVVVEDNLDGTMTATPSKTEAYEFVNTYKMTEATLDGKKNLEVTKKFTGKAWAGEEFKFKLEPTGDTVNNKNVVNGTQEIVLTKADIIENGITGEDVNIESVAKKAFGDIKFKAIGKYTFKISEVKEGVSADNGTTEYASNVAEITVNVDDNKQGALEAAVSATTKGSLVFTNKYTPKSVEIGGEDPENPDNDPHTYGPINVNKVLNGRDLLESDKWNFVIAKAEGMGNIPMPAVTSVENNGGNAAFGSVKYNKPGEYKYVITEENIKDKKYPSITNDTGKVNVTVKVTYNAETGNLSATTTYAKGEEAGNTFVNTYNAVPADAPAVFSNMLKTVTAEVEGNAYTIKGGEFNFELIPDEQEGNPVKETQTATNSADGNITFLDGVKFNVPGEYTYTVKETANDVHGIKNSTDIYTITVKVEDHPDTGKLTAVATVKLNSKAFDGQIVFDNKYNPDSAAATFGGTKKLNVLHGQKEISDGDFTFKLAAVSENAPLPEVTEVNNIGAAFAFDAITFVKPGTYNYKITEVNGQKTGYGYSDAVYNVAVEVTDNAGKLETSVKVNGEPVDGVNVEFTNTYAPTPVILTGDTAIRVYKNLEGRELLAGDFKFALNGENVKLTAENDAEGNVVFGDITISDPGTYNYRINEIVENAGGVTYDKDTVYNVAVKVSDLEGTLHIDSITYTRKGEEVEGEEVAFNNIYKPNATCVTLGASKALNGRKMKADEFTFVLTDAEGKVLQTVHNDVNGAIAFEKFDYDKAGTYVYYVTEKAGNEKHMTYDESKYMVTVKVTDDKNGNLVPTVEITKDGNKVNSIGFVNKYEEPKKPTPKTGDESGLAGFGLAAGISAMLLAITRRKEREDA